MDQTARRLWISQAGLLIGVWIAGLLLLGLLQISGTGFGFRIWPRGEDRVWIYLLQNSSCTGLTKAFWAINDRNPLAPWWYLLAKPLLVSGRGPGMYLLRRLIDLFCALSVFALVNRLGRARQHRFALSCALLTLLWTFSAYREQILWDFLGALALSLLSLWAYCRYIDSGRRHGPSLALSILLYLFAIGTYTLQASSFLAVFFLAVWRDPRAPNEAGWPSRIVKACLDCSYYVAAFVFLLMLWVTAARPSSDYYEMSLALLPIQLPESLAQAAWHATYTGFLQDVRAHWHLVPMLLTVGGGAIACALWFWSAALLRRRIQHGSVGRQVEPAEPSNTRGVYVTLAATFGVAVALVLCTVFVESTSSAWPPGSRVLMVQQVFQPLVYCSALFGAVNLLRPFHPKLANWVEMGFLSTLCGGVFLVGLEYNRQLNQLTAADKHFLSCLHDALPKLEGPTNVIVKLDGVPRPEFGFVSHRYIQTYYGSSAVNLQFFRPGAAITAWDGCDTMVFGPPSIGVQMMNADERVRWTPYSQIVFACYDGKKARLLEGISDSDAAGCRVGFAGVTRVRSEYPLLKEYLKQENPVAAAAHSPQTP